MSRLTARFRLAEAWALLPLAACLGVACAPGGVSQPATTEQPDAAESGTMPRRPNTPRADGAVAPADVTNGAGEAGATPDAPTAPIGPSTRMTFEPLTHTFTDAIEVKLSADHPEAKIHYTLDDTIPGATSPVYAAPIVLSATTMVRAVVISEKAGTGEVVNHSYLKVDGDVAAFTSNLPVIVLHTPKARPTKKGDWVRPSSATVFEADPGTKRTGLLGRPSLNVRAGVRIRGSSTAAFPKKSYKLELWKGGPDDNGGAFPLLGMPADSDWALWAPYEFDRSYVRNPLAFAMSNELGRWAPRTRFVEVFFAELNRTVTMADYIGAYVVMETIKRDKNRVNITDLATTDVAEPEVTGGYIFKIDRLNSGRPGIPNEKGFVAGRGPADIFATPNYCTTRNADDGCALRLPLAFDHPDERVMQPNQIAYLTGAIDRMADDIAARRDYNVHLDEGSFIDHNIIQAFTKNPDGLRLSGYFHKNRGGKVIAGPVWDFDRTMGCAKDDRAWNPEWWDTRYENKTRVVDATRYFEHAWYDGLFQYPEFKAKYFKRWRELLAGPWTVAALHGMIDDFAAEIGTEAPARDYARWTASRPRKDENDVMYVGTHADEIAILKRWVKARAEWIDQCLQTAEQAGSDPIACTGAYKIWPPNGTK